MIIDHELNPQVKYILESIEPDGSMSGDDWTEEVYRKHKVREALAKLREFMLQPTDDIQADLANQIAWLKQRLDYPMKSDSNTFSRADVISNIVPIINNLIKEVKRLNAIAAESKHDNLGTPVIFCAVEGDITTGSNDVEKDFFPTTG